MERSYTGKLTKADCGMAGFDWCGIEENQELVVKFDIRQCRVKQFRLDSSKIVKNYLYSFCKALMIRISLGSL